MIRVNLLRNRVQDPAAGMAPVMESSGNETRENIVKVAFMVLFTFAAIVYEGQHIGKLNTEVAVLQNQVSAIEAEAQAKAQEVLGIRDIAAQAKELQDKLKVLTLLSSLRLREVKTLDFMQTSIPEKVWLRNLEFNSNSQRMEEGRFKFLGNAVSTDDLAEFVKKLEDSAYLREVIVTKNQEVAGPTRSTNVRQFEFSAEVEAIE